MTLVTFTRRQRTVNRRLFWALESQNRVSNAHCGFRRHRSTLDHLVNLEFRTERGVFLRQHLVALFFEFVKAYDTFWRPDVLRTIHCWNLRVRSSLFIPNFL